MEPKDLILQTARELGLTMTAEFVPFSQSRNKADKLPSLNWRVTIKRMAVIDGAYKPGSDRHILTTDYSAGCAHAPSYKQEDRSVYHDDRVRWECEHGMRARGEHVIYGVGKVLQPEFANVLYSLVSDAGVLDCGTFEDWAGDFGYDTDSRKAEAIYRACLDTALKLRNGIGECGLARLRDACQDY